MLVASDVPCAGAHNQGPAGLMEGDGVFGQADGFVSTSSKVDVFCTDGVHDSMHSSEPPSSVQPHGTALIHHTGMHKQHSQH